MGKATATTWLAVTPSHNTTAHGVRDVSLHILTRDQQQLQDPQRPVEGDHHQQAADQEANGANNQNNVGIQQNNVQLIFKLLPLPPNTQSLRP